MRLPQLPADDPERLAAARPWRQRAWERVPGWAKIGLIAFGTLAVIHIALTVRIWYGLQDPPEVAAIQAAPLVTVVIEKSQWSQNYPETWGKAAVAGLIGVTARDVISVNLNEQATDELVAYVAQHFPNVNSLYLADGTVTTQGLMALKQCQQLHYLNVSGTKVDDGLAELLPHLPRLNMLYVMNTAVGDEFARAAAQCDHLRDIHISDTDISFDVVQAWKVAQPKCRIIPDWDCCRVHGEICWSDGEITRRYPGPYEIKWDGPQTNDRSWSHSRTLKSTNLEPRQLVNLGWRGDTKSNGHYQVTLKLNEVESTPASFKIDSGYAYPRNITFRMPITRSEALARLSD